MTALAGILTQGLHIALVVAIAPLLLGAIRWLKARMLGRAAPHPLQPLRDMRKLLQKRPVMAENASWITRAAPYAAAGTALVALALVPGFARGMAFAPLSDLLLLAGLLALGRVSLELARIEAGFRDPAFALLLAPLAALRDAVAARAEGLRGLSIRQALMLPFGTLVALLALVAWLERAG